MSALLQSLREEVEASTSCEPYKAGGGWRVGARGEGRGAQEGGACIWRGVRAEIGAGGEEKVGGQRRARERGGAAGAYNKGGGAGSVPWQRLIERRCSFKHQLPRGKKGARRRTADAHDQCIGVVCVCVCVGREGAWGMHIQKGIPGRRAGREAREGVDGQRRARGRGGAAGAYIKGGGAGRIPRQRLIERRCSPKHVLPRGKKGR